MLRTGTSSLPGLFEPTIFSGRRIIKPPSVFIKAMHPKTEISATPAAVEKILRAGWAGQMKIHGHRAQIHISADSDDDVLTYNRQGQLHRKILPPEIVEELRRILDLDSGWTVIDAEWIKPDGKLFIFDVLKSNDVSLRGLTYGERYKRLPKLYLSPHIQTLPLVLTKDKCMEVLTRPEDYIEGLVFKSLTTKGFSDTSIVRCRKRR